VKTKNKGYWRYPLEVQAMTVRRYPSADRRGGEP